MVFRFGQINETHLSVSPVHRSCPAPLLATPTSAAPAYDILTADYRHDRWLAVLEALAREHGLSGHALLDVACGTGKSFLPLLARGYRVVGCDISPAMLALAAEKAPEVQLVQADMRTLGRLGAFDLVTCLDDALNYLSRPPTSSGAGRHPAQPGARGDRDLGPQHAGDVPLRVHRPTG